MLQADAGVLDMAIATALHVGTATVERIRKRFVEEGLEAALSERPRPGKCWTMQLLADKLVELKQVESISDETVRRTLKKTSSSRG